MASTTPRYAYLISRRLDPVFAVAVGTAAAVMRVRRDEMEKGQSAQETWETLKRRVAYTTGLANSDETIDEPSGAKR